MKKIFFYLGIAAMALGLASCEPKEKIDWDKVTVNGFYVAGPATGSDEIKPDCVMAVGFNEVDKAVRDGMYEKYIVLEADKEFYLLYNDGNTKSRYSATLAQFNTPEEEAYADNPPSVMKGKLVIGDDAPAMKVAKTGLYHIVLDINKTGDLDAAGGAQILLLDASDFGVRGGMNGWGFTSADPKVTEFSNDGVTFNFKDQELGKGGEFKFATGNYWKVTLDDAGKVKAEVSLAAGMTLNGDNIKVDKGGLYDIALTFKLAQGSFDKSFSYTAVCTQESTAPETMYMNGGQWGGANWDWSADGIVELVPVWGAPGYFWCTRWFDGSQEFKFCAKKEWNGDFGDNGNNCKVPESGFYTVLVNGNENTVEIKPAEVYVIGLCGTAKTENQDVWDFNGADVLKLAADGQVLKGTLASSAELRIASKVHPAAPIDGVTTGNGWIDWWKTEFIFFDGKIAYRGAGNDQERVQGVAGKVLVLDFNNGTAALEDGGLKAQWEFSETAMEAYKDNFGGTAGVKDKTAGDGGMFVNSNVTAGGKITYVQVDKTELDVDDKASRITGATGHPYVTGPWTGDYWLFTLSNGSKIAAGSQAHIKYITRVSKTGPKYWVIEYNDGNAWQPAGEIKTEEEVQHNLVMTDDGKTNVTVDVTFTLAADVDAAQFRMRVASMHQASGAGVLAKPNGGTSRIAGAAAEDGTVTSPIFEIL